MPDVASCVAIGGYGDCDDSDSWVYPGAPDLCDGQYNDCSNGDYSAIDLPDDEADLDADGYVECDADGSVWVGPTTPTGYSDCEDDDPTSNGVATELCDGIFNS